MKVIPFISVLILLAGCSTDIQSSVMHDLPPAEDNVTADVSVLPLQVIWMATSRMLPSTEESYGLGGFAEATYATNGETGKFVCSIRVSLPALQDGQTYKAWLMDRSPLGNHSIELGSLESADGSIVHTLSYEENFSASLEENLRRYSAYLTAVITREPESQEILSGKMSVIQSVSINDSLQKNNKFQ